MIEPHRRKRDFKRSSYGESATELLGLPKGDGIVPRSDLFGNPLSAATGSEKFASET